MDVTQALKDAENSLRDFIAFILRKALGDNWELESGVTLERIERWKERKQIEEKRQESGTVDERLIYYSDFYDLKTILKKHWQAFSPALGEWKTMEAWLTELEKLRDPDAHRRELLPHQQHLILGLSGEIRTRIVRFRSHQDTEESYFPRIESARDNLGNIWVPGKDVRIVTNHRLHPNDTVEFIVTATDPLGGDVEYALMSDGKRSPWQKDNILSLRLLSHHIRKKANMIIIIRSTRDYHASGEFDDMVVFIYSILPAP